MKKRHLVFLFPLVFLLSGFSGPNVKTSFSPEVSRPAIEKSAYIHKLASVIGNGQIGEKVFAAPFASIRGDEGQPIYIGHESNVQDGCVVHGLETFDDGKTIEKNQVEASGKKYSVYIGSRVSMAHQSQVHGPAKIGNDTFVGMQSLVFKSTVGDHVVIEPKAMLFGVTGKDGRYVPAGSPITTQVQADALPKITDKYRFKHLNEGVVHVNKQFAEEYR